MRQRQKPFREHILNRMRGTLKRCIRAHSEVYLPQVSEAPKYFEGGGEKKGEKNKIFPPHTYTHPQLSPLASDKIDKVVGFHDATRLATLHNSAIHFFKQKNRSFLPHQPGRPSRPLFRSKARSSSQLLCLFKTASIVEAGSKRGTERRPPSSR